MPGSDRFRGAGRNTACAHAITAQSRKNHVFITLCEQGDCTTRMCAGRDEGYMGTAVLLRLVGFKGGRLVAGCAQGIRKAGRGGSQATAQAQAGNEKSNRVPACGALSTAMVLECRSRMRLAMASPSPIPSCALPVASPWCPW